MGIDAGRAVDLSGIVAGPAAPNAPASTASQTELMLPGLALQADESNFSSVIDISNTVPVVVCFVLNLDTDEPMLRVLTDSVTNMAGQVVLVTIDATANPQLAASFQVDALSAAKVVSHRSLPPLLVVVRFRCSPAPSRPT